MSDKIVQEIVRKLYGEPDGAPSMNDIEERLRNFHNYCELDEIDALKRDAADEIARLKAYVEEWKQRFDIARLAYEDGRVKIKRLRAEKIEQDVEIERVRSLADNLAQDNERLLRRAQRLGIDNAAR